MTPGWAAPEQIVGDDVHYATDQYALGLLLCMLIEGVIYGEEVTFIVPVGGNKTEKFVLLRNAGIYLPPELAPVDADGLGPWQRFLARCLRWAPAERFSAMADLAPIFVISAAEAPAAPSSKWRPRSEPSKRRSEARSSPGKSRILGPDQSARVAPMNSLSH